MKHWKQNRSTPSAQAAGLIRILNKHPDEHLMDVDEQTYGALRQAQLAAGVPDALLRILYLAGLADTRFLIFDPSASTLPGLSVYDE